MKSIFDLKGGAVRCALVFARVGATDRCL